MPFDDKGFVESGLPISTGAVVRGNYSKCSYLVQEARRYDNGKSWYVQAHDLNDKRSTVWFNNLGERRGNEIDMPNGDKLLIISEPESAGQMTMEL